MAQISTSRTSSVQDPLVPPRVEPTRSATCWRRKALRFDLADWGSFKMEALDPSKENMRSSITPERELIVHSDDPPVPAIE